MNLVKPCLLATALLALAPMASAANKSASFGVQLIVQNECTFTAGGTASDINFGTVTGNIAADRDAATNLAVNCNNGAAYHIGLNNGLNATAGGQRRMTGTTGAYVSYELFTTAQRDVAWGATAAGGTATDVDATRTNAAQTVTLYGRVPSGESVGAGTYNDTITATIEY